MSGEGILDPVLNNTQAVARIARLAYISKFKQYIAVLKHSAPFAGGMKFATQISPLLN